MLTEQDICWRAVEDRDVTADGQFYYAVQTTKIYCRPSCASRRPRKESVTFFSNCLDAEEAGFRACLRCRPRETNQSISAVTKCCRYIEVHFEESITLQILAGISGQSATHLQRTFKRIMGISPREYTGACRIEGFRDALRAGKPVVEALLDVGFGSTSRVYERANKRLGMTPVDFKKGGEHLNIKFSTTETSLGWLLAAATVNGICSITLGNDANELVKGLRRDFPAANLSEDVEGLKQELSALVRHIEGDIKPLDIPLDVQATAFQRRVWQELQHIPYGETRSYGEVATAIGKPTAVRAVARACATNPTALVVPCHRVVRCSGALSGYRWGVERKQRLLDRESKV